MKKFTKICLIICGILAGLGILLAVIGTTMGFGFGQIRSMVKNGELSIGENDFNGIGWSRAESEDENDDGKWAFGSEEWDAPAIKELDVEFDFGTLEILPSENDKVGVRVQYRNIWGDYGRNIKWKRNGDTLEIKDNVDKKILKLFSTGTEDALLTIFIPEGKEFEELTIDVGAAEVKLETGLAATEMELTLGAGDIEGTKLDVDNIRARELNLDIGAGHMLLEGITAKTLDADCGTGEMEIFAADVEKADIDCGVGNVDMQVTGLESDYNYNVDCGIGQVLIGESSYSGLGSSKQIQNGADKHMDIDCGIGEISVKFLGENE